MGLFAGHEAIKTINLREDYNIQVGVHQTDDFAANVLTQKKNGERHKSYMLEHRLLKKCYGVPGIQDGTKALLICNRDVLFDPLNQFPDLTGKDTIKGRIKEMAWEQLNKAEEDKNGGLLNITQILMAASAFILFGAIALITLISHYRG